MIAVNKYFVSKIFLLEIFDMNTFQEIKSYFKFDWMINNLYEWDLFAAHTKMALKNICDEVIINRIKLYRQIANQY